MAQQLGELKVAILATDGFEQIELIEPRKALEAAGAIVEVVAPKSGKIQGWNHFDKADQLDVDVTLNEADASEYDALVLPGGVINPDQLRLQPKAIDFIREFSDANKPIAAICHGPWTLINAGAAQGKKLTSWPSLQTDLENAGATWVDEKVVRDGNIVTSRKPDDIPDFNREMIDLFASSRTAGAQQAGQRRQPSTSPGAMI